MRIAGQGYLNASSVEKTTAYLTPLCGPYTVPESVVKVWAKEMARNAGLENLAATRNSQNPNGSGWNSRNIATGRSSGIEESWCEHDSEGDERMLEHDHPPAVLRT